MTKGEAYNALLEKVQQAGGYIAFKAKKRPCIMLNDNGVYLHTIVAALFIGNDESSPLKLISTRSVAWDVDDYLGAEDIEHILSRL